MNDEVLRSPFFFAYPGAKDLDATTATVLPGKARQSISNGAGVPRQRWRGARGMGDEARDSW